MTLTDRSAGTGASAPAPERIEPRIYRARTTHRRFAAAPAGLDRRFAYATCAWLIDVDRPPALPRPLRPLLRFQARDHLGDPDRSIADNARALLAEHGLAADRILLLTCPRTLGHVFNPLSVFYCLRRRAEPAGPGDGAGPGDADGDDDANDDGAYDDGLVAVIAEVHNTYGGRHVYLMRPGDDGTDRVDKAFYVSPFLPMGGTYTMRTPLPGERLAVTVTLRQGGTTRFVATLTGTGESLTTRAAVRALLRWPLLTLRTSALIRWQGIRLWLRRVPVQPRPADATADERGR